MGNIKQFSFQMPTEIRFGVNSVSEIGDVLKEMDGRKNIFVVTDKGLIKAGIVDCVLAAIKNAGYTKITVFDETEPNPRDTTVQKAYKKAKHVHADLLVAIGGGSSMDTAKAVGTLLEHGGIIQDYEGGDKLTKPITPLIAIPTTVGTGSEVTYWAVITDTQRHFKMSIGGPLMAPKVALVDPELVKTLPPAITASTGMDALTHAIEGYTASVSEPITDACGLYAIELIAKNLRNAVYTEASEAKANMLIGSLIAGICFGNSDVAAVHCMAEALGGLYDTPHGVANAMLLPVVMEYNYVADIEKFARIAKAMGENDLILSERDMAYQAVSAVEKLTKDLNIPTMKEIGIKACDLERLARASSENMCVESNNRKIGYDEFLDLFQIAYNR